MAGERTLPGLGLTAFWNAGDNTWKPGNDENMRKLSAVVQLRVLSRTIWPPSTDDSNSAAVANGDMYIVPASDSNSLQDSNSDDAFGDIAVHDNGNWVFYTPQSGWIAYVVDEAQHFKFEGGQWVQMGGSAENIAYSSGDGGDSNSTETSVAGALDDLYERVRNVSAGIVDATTVSYNSADGGDSNSTATTVQEALDDLYGITNLLSDQLDALDSTITFENRTAGKTLTAADNKHFYLHDDDSNSGDFALYGLPADSLEDLPDGFTVSWTQIGNTQVELVAAEDSNSPDDVTMIYPIDRVARTRGPGSTITALKTSTANRWVIFGDLESL